MNGRGSAAITCNHTPLGTPDGPARRETGDVSANATHAETNDVSTDITNGIVLTEPEENRTNTTSDIHDSDPEDAATVTDDATTESDDDDSVYAPDGGWGWMVTIGSFMVEFLANGIVASFGLLLPELLATYNAGMSLTSFPQAIIVGMFLLSGPVTAFLVRRLGCRPVGFCGGLLAFLGVLGSAFSPSIELFILSFGVVAGVGIGLVYLPSVTMVNIYFNKKRGIVAGIVTSGAGFGTLALAPLTEILIEEYGWRGCYFVMAAVVLHFCVCACLMRPLKPPKRQHSQLRESDIEEDPHLLHSGGELEIDYVSLCESNGCSGRGGGKPSSSCNPGHGTARHIIPFMKSRDEDEMEFNICSLEEIDFADDGLHSLSGANKSHHHHHHHHDGSGAWNNSMKNLFLSSHTIGKGSHHKSGSKTEQHAALTSLSRSHGHLHSQTPSKSRRDSAHINPFSTWLACQVPPSLSRHSLHSHHYSSDKMAHARSVSHCHGEGGHRKGELPWSSRRSLQRYHSDSRVQFCNQQPRDTFRARSEDFVKTILKLTRFKAHSSSQHAVKPDRTADKLNHEDAAPPVSVLTNGGSLLTNGGPCHVAPAAIEEEDTWVHAESSGGRAHYCVARWVRDNRTFLLFLVGAFLLQMVSNVTLLLTPSYAYLHGVGKDRTATILSVYGLMNSFGRLLAGALVYWGCRALLVHNVGTFLAGVTCFVFPLCTTFPSITACLALHGLFLAAFAPLQHVLLVEYLGIERLASTFGIMCFVKAFASAAGPPLAGLLYAQTGRYTVPVIACGGIFVVTAILTQMMACFPKPRLTLDSH